MELFASPMACSLASHITALEAGLPVKVRFVENKKTDDGGDYYKISAKGYVPALRLDDGQILNEGPSVLQYLADRKPDSGLAPAWGTVERYQLIDTLNYLNPLAYFNGVNTANADHLGTTVPLNVLTRASITWVIGLVAIYASVRLWSTREA